MTKPLVVSDSSSLILAAKAGLLGPICTAFWVIIPERVFEETVLQGKQLQKADAWKIEKAVLQKKIRVKKLRPAKDIRIENLRLDFNLGKGEAEAIELYFQSRAKLLLVDDKQAINMAKLLEVSWVTLPALLVGLVEKKRISKLDALESLQILQEEGRYKLGFILDAFYKIEKRGE